MNRATMRKLVRNRQLRWLMGAWTAFYMADLAHFTLAVVYAFGAGGAAAVGAATVLNVLPGGLIGPFVAVLASSPRPQMHLALGIGGRCLVTVATLVAVLLGMPVGIVLALLAADSLVSAGVRPLHGALIVRLADTVSEAAAANAATSSLVNAAALIGPMLAGAALSILGIGWAFAVPAVVFAAGMVASALIKVPSAPADEPEATLRTEKYLRSHLREVMGGFRGIVASGPAAAATALFFANMTLMGAWWVISAPVASDRLGLGEAGITTILTLDGLGGLIGALGAMGTVGRRRLARILFDGMIALAILLAAIGLIVEPVLGLAVAVGVGGAGAVAYAISPTLVQRSVAKDAMVPAAASLQSLYLLGIGAGGALAPILLETIGLIWTLVLAGGTAAAVTLVAWPQLRRADVLSDEDASKLGVLRATPALAALPALALEQLARVATRLEVPAGSEVIRQGDPGDRYYVIADGLAEVSVDGRRVATLGRGGSFGEIALLHDVPRSASVIARKDLDLVAVDRAEFLSALSNDAGGVTRLGGVAQARLETLPVEERLVEVDRDAALGDRSVVELLASQPPLASIPSDALRELAETAKVVAAPDGAIVTREGDHGCAYYVVLDGTAEIIEGDVAVGRLGPGDGFDEAAILRDVPHASTVRALGDITLMAVDRESFRRARQPG